MDSKIISYFLQLQKKMQFLKTPCTYAWIDIFPQGKLIRSRITVTIPFLRQENEVLGLRGETWTPQCFSGRPLQGHSERADYPRSQWVVSPRLQGGHGIGSANSMPPWPPTTAPGVPTLLTSFPWKYSLGLSYAHKLHGIPNHASGQFSDWHLELMVQRENTAAPLFRENWAAWWYSLITIQHLFDLMLESF